MLVSGIVGTVPRDSSFETKSGEKVKQWAFKLLDDTAEIVPCVVPMDGLVLTQGTKIKAQVKGIRAIKFGEGYVCQLEHVEVTGDVVSFGSTPSPLKK